MCICIIMLLLLVDKNVIFLLYAVLDVFEEINFF